ncbi:hypothetical protein I4U23_006931 [Adineta vaga]|nr:hypothetical protein I4U23_006931 [Adineta vaga]
MFPLNNQDDEILSQKTMPKNISSIDENDIVSKVNELHLKQIELEEKFHEIKNETEQSSSLQDKLNIFRQYIWNCCSNVYNWKSLVRSIYHLKHLIYNLDNYQIKQTIDKDFKILFNDFILFLKYLITIQMKSIKVNDELNDITTVHNQIDQYVIHLKDNVINLKESILIAKERFHLCQTDDNALQLILQAIDKINFESRNFDKQDEENIHLLKFQQDLLEKSNKTDLIQFKIYIDQQVKNLLELNKQNANELEKIKLMKTGSCQAHQMQTILSNYPFSKKSTNRMYSYQSSQPYITYELDYIRQYQRQALLKSPYGTIPLYRRQAWAAANLFQNHSLHSLRYLQNSLRLQIHHLLGYDPSNIYNTMKKKKSNIQKIMFHNSQDIEIVGTNNQLYRGQIDSCERIPLKKSKEKKRKIKINHDDKIENMKINFDQFNQSDKTLTDEYLFQYIDWQAHLNEQDLPDELCKVLFEHWQTIVCEDQPCQCKSELEIEENVLNEIEIKPSILSIRSHEYHRCICKDCTCECEKYSESEELQTISDDIKDSLIENQDVLSNHSIIEETKISSRKQISNIEPMEEIIISNCFIHQNDQWTRQFNLFPNIYPSSNPLVLTNHFHLDDPTAFRQQILNRHYQSEEHN